MPRKENILATKVLVDVNLACTYGKIKSEISPSIDHNDLVLYDSRYLPYLKNHNTIVFFVVYLFIFLLRLKKKVVHIL